MVYMAENIKENRVVEDKPRNKWAGIPMTEEQKKEYKKVWEEIETNIFITKLSKCILT